MGQTKEQLSNEYWFTWYNNATPAMNQGFRIANMDTLSGNTVEVWVGNTKLQTISLAGGGSTRVSYNVDNGPVKIVCITCTKIGRDEVKAAMLVICKERRNRSRY